MACSRAKILMTQPMEDDNWRGRGEKTLAESRGKIRTPYMVSSSASKERDVTAPPLSTSPQRSRRSGISFVLSPSCLSISRHESQSCVDLAI